MQTQKIVNYDSFLNSSLKQRGDVSHFKDLFFHYFQRYLVLKSSLLHRPPRKAQDNHPTAGGILTEVGGVSGNKVPYFGHGNFCLHLAPLLVMKKTFSLSCFLSQKAKYFLN